MLLQMKQRSQSDVRILELSRSVIQESQQSYCKARPEEGVESFEDVGVGDCLSLSKPLMLYYLHSVSS